jgi:predicted AlkP superfamily phosphohydrolase/phosphomutase
MVSDHGFAVIHTEIVMEQLLKEIGLAPRDAPTEYWHYGEYASQAKVFVMDPCRFYINRKNSRFPHGCVEPEEEADIIASLKQALMELKDPDSGRPIVNTIRTKEEGFWGDQTEYAPDLVAATEPGYYLKAFQYENNEKIIQVQWEANHVWNDAIVYTPYPIKSDHQVMVWDVLATALHDMGIQLPDHLDGVSLRLN